MKNPRDVYYTENHEWVRVEEGQAYVGITNHAQEELGEVVFVELPSTETHVERGEEVLTVESLKAATQIYAPISGNIVEVNEELDETPDLLNEEPFEQHIFVLEIEQREELEALLTAEDYENFLEEA